jgi:lysophospholipase L1-like esterase
MRSTRFFLNFDRTIVISGSVKDRFALEINESSLFPGSAVKISEEKTPESLRLFSKYEITTGRIMNPRNGLIVICAAMALQINAAEKNTFYLRDGDRVVFYGDSITDQRLYTTFTETYVLTRFPKMDVSFVHSGWGGDRVTGGGGGNIDTRLKRDVLAYKPTVMTIMLGMNDASYRAFDEKIFQTYTNGYQHIIDVVKKEIPNIRFTLIQPSPFDDVTRATTFEGGYNNVLLRYGDFVKDLAAREHATVADMNKPFVAAIEKANAKDHDLAIKINPDRVHPSSAGHLLMAEQLLKAWNAPAEVTLVEIDANGKKIGKTERAKVSDLSLEKGVAWTQKDEALPMPVDFKDPAVSLAMNSSDFMEALNRETLKVTGLSGNNYRLAIDGEDVGKFSREQLAEGINLALFQTPMWKQAQDVHKLTVQHNNLHFARWRQLQVPFDSYSKLSDYEKALKAVDALEEDLVKEQRKTAEPKSHKYQLIVAD